MMYRKITMVDDSSADANLVRRAVERMNQQIEFNWIADAEEACTRLQQYARTEDEVILLDIKMPKITGLEILQRLAELGKIDELPPIIILSSSSLERDIKQVKQYPGVLYRAKPEGYLGMKTLVQEILQH